MDEQASKTAFVAIHEALAADARTKDPMNALVVWTELGKGLAGMLERAGAEPGMLRDTIDRWSSGQPDVLLEDWLYKPPPAERLSTEHLGAALRRVEEALERALPSLAAAAETSDEARKRAYLVVLRGWFPVGLDVIRSLPGARDRTESEAVGALRAWCDRYLPRTAAGASALGVRVERR